MNDTTNATFQNLETINSREVERSATLITYLCLIALTGIPGNLFVCFTNKPQHSISISRYFIFWLAVSDSIGCGTIILELVSVCMPYVYPCAWLCQVTIYTEVGTVMMSSGLLTTISIDRYMMVCRPHGIRIRRKQASLIIAILFALALLFSLPVFVFYGLREYPLNDFNITGLGCQVRNQYDDSGAFKAYSGFLWLCFVTSLIIMTSLYTLIGRQIFSRLGSKGNRRTSVKFEPSSLNVSPSESSQARFSTNSVGKTRVTSAHLSNPYDATGKGSTGVARIRRSVFIMFLISLVFVVSFVPYLTLRAIQAASGRDFVTNMTDSERTAYKFFLRMYFLNCTSNPFIYGACMPQFRNDLKKYWQRFCSS